MDTDFARRGAKHLISFNKHVILCEMYRLGAKIVVGRRSYARSRYVIEEDVVTTLDFIGRLRLSYRTLNAGEASWGKRGLYMLELKESGGLYGSVRVMNLYSGDGVDHFKLVHQPT